MSKFTSIFRKWFPKSLSQEVIAVFDSAPGIKKLGWNEEEEYAFLEIQAICREFKGELFQRGIVLAAVDVECEFQQISDKEKGFLERCTVRTKFEARRNCWFGVQRFDMGEALGAGTNHQGELALSTAQTMALKAMLKRSSMTYGENDDAEAKKRVDDHQQRTWDAAVSKSRMTLAEISTLLSRKFCFDVHAENIPKLPKPEFDTAVMWLLNHRDLTSEWSDAVVDISSKKGIAQPVVQCIDAAKEAGY